MANAVPFLVWRNMSANDTPQPLILGRLEAASDSLTEGLEGGRARKYARFVVAALSSIPWIGGVIGASASFSAERDQEQINELHKLWLAEHKEKVRELVRALSYGGDEPDPQSLRRREQPLLCYEEVSRI
jgi:hypothetical protein